ncbi:MAG TPA: long-chain fatty acid--CoA ligase, partial [Nitrospirota bacterium]|nr:long-chain fatty acid--CoA ligase [Nitrospirota bacterium]
MTLGERLSGTAAAYPRRVALAFEGRKYSYRELDGLVSAFARGLAGQGVGEGDRVALLLPNCPEFAVAYFGASRAGAVVVPVNTFLAAPEMLFILKDSGASLVVVSSEHHEKLARIKDALPGLKAVSTGPGLPGALDFKSLLEEGKNDAPGTGVERGRQTGASPDDAPAAILYTSGTTGNPKGAVLSHGNLLSNASACAEAFRVTKKDRFLLFLPMFHAFSFLVCLLLPLTLGARVIILPSVKPFSRVIKAIIFGGATFFIAIPTVYSVLSMKKFPRIVFPLLRLRLCVSGAAPLPREVIERFARNYPVPLLEGYGLTEASPVVSCNPLDGTRKPGSAGIPIPGVEVRAVSEDGAALPPGQVGEIAVRGHNVMKGYLNNPSATAEAIRDGWLFTGDLGYVDDEGYIYIVDRKKDLIIVHGMNIYPREVEEALYTHPAVRQAAVVGVPDPGKGETPKAFVALHEGTSLTEKEVKAYLRERVAGYKVPRQVEFVESLPVSPTGKVL